MSTTNSNKTHWKKLFNYDYLGSHSLVPGKDMILTIQGINKQMVTGEGGRKDECVVCIFKEGVKPMIINKTNCRIIHAIYKTAFVEDWIGKRIQVYVKQGIRAKGGELVEGLRIREQEPQLQTGEEAHKKELKAQIRTALGKYTKDDKDSIRTMLTEKQNAGEDTVEFLKNQLEHLTQ